MGDIVHKMKGFLGEAKTTDDFGKESDLRRIAPMITSKTDIQALIDHIQSNVKKKVWFFSSWSSFSSFWTALMSIKPKKLVKQLLAMTTIHLSHMKLSRDKLRLPNMAMTILFESCEVDSRIAMDASLIRGGSFSMKDCTLVFKSIGNTSMIHSAIMGFKSISGMLILVVEKIGVATKPAGISSSGEVILFKKPSSVDMSKLNRKSVALFGQYETMGTLVVSGDNVVLKKTYTGDPNFDDTLYSYLRRKVED